MLLAGTSSFPSISPPTAKIVPLQDKPEVLILRRQQLVEEFYRLVRMYDNGCFAEDRWVVDKLCEITQVVHFPSEASSGGILRLVRL